MIYESATGRADRGRPDARDLSLSLEPEAARLAAVIERCLRRDPAPPGRLRRRAARGAERPAAPALGGELPEGNRTAGSPRSTPSTARCSSAAARELRAVIERLRADPFVLVTGDLRVLAVPRGRDPARLRGRPRDGRAERREHGAGAAACARGAGPRCSRSRSASMKRSSPRCCA